MARILVFYIFLEVWFISLDCEVYQDRPKIRTSDGDLILEPAFDKNIYLRPNGPKSNIYVGKVNILNTKPNTEIDEIHSSTNSDVQELLNGPNGIVQRLAILEKKALPVPDDLFLNISTLWKRVNSINRRLHNLQTQFNSRGFDACQSAVCQHGGTCLDLLNGYHCLCPSNWEGNDCDVDVNECRNFAGTDLGCQNGATCINKPGYYECICKPGWYGLHCTRKLKDCSGGDFEMCGHGTCLSDSTRPGITCICHQGWTTNGTSSECLTDVNECESYQGPRCSVNPKVACINTPGSFRCGQCPPGYEGDGYSCADIDECITIPNGGCNPLVACHNTVGSRICGPCPPGYQGDGITCSWRGSCNIDHGGCHPSAQCVENLVLGRTVQCICPPGMDGNGIGIHGCYVSTDNTQSCSNNPCIHGQCHMLRSGYTCICQRGYRGSHCDTPSNSCSMKPCRNGGVCRLDESTNTGFRCECTAQFTGSRCQIPSRTCGGVLDAEEGSIVHPLSNTTYNHNSSCAWVIHIAPNKVINVTFSKFSLEESVNAECIYDFLQIHDGRSSASQLIGRFCGNTLPNGGNILSSHNHLYLWFRADSSVSQYGFSLHWTSVDPVCGGEISVKSHGRISSPGSPGKYPPNRDCYWHLTAPYGKKIELHFFTLDIENHPNCSFDYLAIYDGMQNTDPLLNKYCNSSQPAPLQSAGSQVMIHFHSDAYGQGNGFQIAYVPIPGIPGCGGHYTHNKGEISSPTYNGVYLNGVLCQYNIKTNPDTKVQIDFIKFDIERSNRCKFDYLKVYDGPSAESPLVGKFCGTKSPRAYVSSSNELYIEFRSDLTKSGEGFKLSYKTICQQTIYGDSGVIKSAGYPLSYPEDRVCEYIISTVPGKVIQLSFQDFDIEDNNYYNCQFDYVEIRDGPDANSTFMGRYCGGAEHTPPVKLSTLNYMYIRFNSDLSITGSGFYANYTTIATECGGIYKERTGLISHPPENTATYNNDQSCTWILVAPEGMHIKLLWHRFELEKMESCESDYLELIEMDSDNNNNIGKFCGTKMPPAFTTTTNRLMLKFKSDSSITHSGFSVSYTFLDAKSHCDAIYFKSHGLIRSPNWPNKYEVNRDCTWVITVPVGQQIRLNISQFELERPIANKCDYGDYLEIRNGATQTSPLVGTYCGKFKSKIITSLANVLHLHFHSDNYITGKGFQIEWDGSLFGCGGTLTSSKGSITSPNYPESYNENSECFYRIITSQGSRIRLNFIDLELEPMPNCNDDYVEIFDGRSLEANSLGRYCVASAGLNNIETSSNYAYIRFRSDAYIGGKGFNLNYFTICNNNLTGRYGVIESPNYPNNYPLQLNCLWNINVPMGNKINVTFSSFDLARSVRYSWYLRMSGNHYSQSTCDQDYLQWKENSETTYSEKLCGSKVPPMITTKSNSLQIKFSTGMTPKSGFRLEWVNFGCGGHIKKRYGTISIDKNTVSSDKLECEWLIETPLGTSISLVFSDVFVKESENCSSDAILVYNGQSKNTPLLTTICNRHLSIIQSTSNFVLIQFIKKSTLSGAYFLSTFSTRKSTCGGDLKSLSGYIYSQNYPKNYDDKLDCKWTISVPTNHRIELNFMDIDLYKNEDDDQTDDCADSIKIYDTQLYTYHTNYTAKVCPGSNMTTFVTNYNRIMVQFTTDDTGNAKGFKANYSITCGATITAARNGIISNEHYIGGSNKSCTWTIRASRLSQKISLTITHLDLPKFDYGTSSNRSCWSSYIRVFDGDDINSPLIDEFCGKKVPPMIVSLGSSITVLLGSYSNEIKGRFSAHYSSLDEACGGTLTSEEGVIASPNYPRSYPNGANCEWILNTSPGNRVYITFEQFDIEYSERCNEDYLEIRQNNGAGPILGVYCGNDIPINTTTATKLYIKFHSSDKNSGKGFLLHYGFLHGNELVNMESGEIASPLYPQLYQGFDRYTWRIQSNGLENIIISVDRLEIPSYGEICSNSLLIYDGYDDTAPLLKKLCGKLSDTVTTVETSSNMAYIKLDLDYTNTGTLFHLKWEKTNINNENVDEDDKINCGSNYTVVVTPGNSSIIQSPNYPNTYDNDLNCQWVFEATKGRHLTLDFDEFNLEETSLCFADYVNVYTAVHHGQWTLVKERLCETQAAKQSFINSTKLLKITFKTDSSVTKKGFQGKIKSKCGGLLTDLSGEVLVDWNDLHIGSVMQYRIECQWTIKVRPGRVINLEFTHFNITNGDNECNTYVTLRNGESAESPFLAGGKYCGYEHEEKQKLTTSSNTLHISYVNTYGRFNARTFQNFKIRYEEKGIDCGGTSQLSEDKTWEVINSPNYPRVSIPFSECIWVFSAPPSEILQIDFIGRFDLDDVDDCGTEMVEVHDGSSILSPLLGKYCSEKPGTVKSSSNALYIRYLTKLSEPRDGFKANISINVCGGTIITQNGEIKSPGYPHIMANIPYGSNCIWRIRGPPSHVFKITAQDIDLPESQTTCGTKIIIEEKIKANDSTVILKRFCPGTDDPKTTIETSTNEFIINLYMTKSSEWSLRHQHRGFRFTFSSSRPTCGGLVTNSEGYVTTPGYPLETAVRYCQWTILVPDHTRRVRLELMDLDAGKHTIGIYNDRNFQALIQNIPGENYTSTTRIFESSGYKIAFFLWMNPLVSTHRFKAKFSSYEKALCGGQLKGTNGELSSPDIQSAYACEWHYNNENIESNTILVTAKVNSSITRNRCRHSDPKLAIKSTLSKRGIMYQRDLCGLTESTFRMPSSIMDLNAIKNKGDSFNFNLKWESNPCGGIINISEDPVNIINFSNTTKDVLDCAWVLFMTYNTKVEIKMEGSFHQDCGDEYIKIGQGLSQYSPEIGYYCSGKPLQDPLITSFSIIYVQLHTKQSNLTDVKLIARTVRNQCGGQLSNYQHLFMTPNFPKSYEPNQECSWTITTEVGNRVSLSFIERFVVEDRPNCTKDVVIIYDWKNNAFDEIARICGRQIPSPYNSTNNIMKVVLRTDATTNADGFKARWTPICGGNFIATDKEQMLYSPGFPNNYPAFSDCTYNIVPPSGKRLQIEFKEFELEGNFPECLSDNVTILGDTDYDSSIVEVYCGSDHMPIVTNYNKITIRFMSDVSVNRRGFKLSYKIYECGGQIKEPTILSSHHGEKYDTDMNCTWFIQAPADKIVTLRFSYIDLETHSECNSDYVAVFDDLLINEDKRLALICGHVNSSTVLRSHGNKALLQFVSDQSYNFKGFKVEVLFTYSEAVGCGGHIDLKSSSSKTFKSFLLGNQVVYENYLDCQWTITTLPDTIIKLEFTSFHIAPCANVNQTALGISKCDCDLVEIKDGLNPESFMIGTYCGHSVPQPVFSSGNMMSVRLSTDGEIASSGFEARVTTQPSVCGQTHYALSRGSNIIRLKSPDYDKGKVPLGVHCAYHFETERYTTVRISFLNLDLRQPSVQDSGKKCMFDKLIIGSQLNSNNLTIGKDYLINHETDSFLSSYMFYLYEDDALHPHTMEYCGNQNPSDIYVSGSLTVSLITSPESDTITHKGFQMEVATLEHCGRNYTGTQGKIQTMFNNRKNDQSESNDCITLITAPENHTISAYFISVSPDYWNDNIYLDIFDGKDTSSAKLVSIKSDYDTTVPVFSTGRYMLLHGHDDDDDRVDFELNYITTDKGRGCGGKLTNVVGRVTSPMYPEIYREVSTCEWELETPIGTRLQLRFDVFDLGVICDQNYVKLVDSKGNVISTYCNEKPADYTSTDNMVKIIFYTTKNNGGTGWVADFIGIRL